MVLSTYPSRPHRKGLTMAVTAVVALLGALTVAAPVAAPPAGAADALAVVQHAGTMSRPEAIVTGPDGNLWFTNPSGDAIGRMTPAGAVTTFTHDSIDEPLDIAVGPDGRLWFTNSGNDTIGRITTTGTV